MSRVIKNNDGVAIVEGTPAASLVKDVDRFFASKPPERMAGQSIYQPRKIDPNNRNLKSITKKAPEADNTMFIGGSKDFNEKTGRVESRPQSERTDEERRANLEAFDRLSEERKREMTINTRRPTPKDLEQMNNPPVEKPAIRSERRPSFENLSTQEQAEVTVARENQMEEKKPIVRGVNPRGDRKPYERHGRPAGGNPNRNKAKEKAESRRERFFQRRRSRKEAVRSQREQEATQGKFITTLGR